jgi:antitoxin VapB
MSVHVQDPIAVAMLRSYAEEHHVGFDEAIKLAVSRARVAGFPTKPRTPEELAETRAALKAIRDEVASWPRTGEVADKAFFDELSGD